MVAPAFTVMEVGAVRALLVWDTVTCVPPAAAGLVRVTVQLVELLAVRLAGLQERDDTSVAAPKLMTAFTELKPTVAVRVAF